MNKDNLIYVGVGVFISYFLFSYIKRDKEMVLGTPVDMGADVQAGTSIISEEVLEDPKISMCKERWIKFAETRKFSSPEQTQATYDNFMTSCVAQS